MDRHTEAILDPEDKARAVESVLRSLRDAPLLRDVPPGDALQFLVGELTRRLRQVGVGSVSARPGAAPGDGVVWIRLFRPEERTPPSEHALTAAVEGGRPVAWERGITTDGRGQLP